MLNTWSNYLEWLTLLGLLGFGLYAMKVVKNEKNFFLKNSRAFQVGIFTINVPPWWSPKVQEEEQLLFVRSDTRYSWEACFQWFKSTKTELNLNQIIENHLENIGVVLDEKNLITLSSSIKLKQINFEMLRFESTGTLNDEERIYQDIVVIRNTQTKDYLLAESKSSVLNGLIEGPYFEEVMKNIKLT